MKSRIIPLTDFARNHGFSRQCAHGYRKQERLRPAPYKVSSPGKRGQWLIAENARILKAKNKVGRPNKSLDK